MTRLLGIPLVLLILGPHMTVSIREKVLTKGICLEGRGHEYVGKKCCGSHIHVEDAECLEAYNANIKRSVNKTTAVSKLANCVFIKKKFTKGTENLNFKRIRADLDNLDDPEERKFKMKMYKYCSEDAKLHLQALKSFTDSEESIPGVRRPFYYFVLLCIGSYPFEISCPYFMWLPTVCGKLIDQCKELVLKKNSKSSN